MVKSGRIPVITGPTAVGKTSISLVVANTLGCEIISADSRQVFRQMHIGTASPDALDLEQVPHHFIAEKELNEPFSAGIFAREAESRIREIRSRGNCPIVVGGSTLYLRALTQGLAEIPDVDPSIRIVLNERLAAEGSRALHRELCDVDPEFASTLDSTKTQRVIRGLEVWIGTGVRLSEHFKRTRAPGFEYKYFVLNRDRIELYARINQRVTEMIETGLLDEVDSILSGGASPDINALQTIGYREIIRHLTGGSEFNATIAEVQKNTRRYAKRQLTWFRKIVDATWIDIGARTTADVASELTGEIRRVC